MPSFTPPEFVFHVVFDVHGLPACTLPFEEVEGLSHDEPEEVSAGRENRFKHRLPTRVGGSVTLKRGMVMDPALIAWLDASEAPRPADVQVMLVGPAGQVVLTWRFVGAVPVRWSAYSHARADQGLIIDQVELAYTHVTLTPGAAP